MLKMSKIIIATAPLGVGTIAALAITGGLVNRSSGQLSQTTSQVINLALNVEKKVELQESDLSFFNGSMPLSPEQIKFIWENNNGVDLSQIKEQIVKNQKVFVTEKVKIEIVDNYYKNGLLSVKSLANKMLWSGVSYPADIQQLINEGTEASRILATQKIIEIWKAGKFRFPWDLVKPKVITPIEVTYGQNTSFTSDIDTYPHDIYLVRKSDGAKLSIINDVHSIVYQTAGPQDDGAIGVNRRINPKKKNNFRFLNRIYDNNKPKPGEFETSFDTFAVSQSETNLMLQQLNQYSQNQAAFLVLKKRPNFGLAHNFAKISSFYPATIEHFFVPMENAEWKIEIEQEVPKPKNFIATIASSLRTKPSNVFLKSNGQRINISKYIKYLVFNKKSSDTTATTLAMTRSFSNKNYKFLNKVLKSGSTKDSRRIHDNLLLNETSDNLIINSKVGVAPEQAVGLVLDGDLSAFPSEISPSTIDGFYPTDAQFKYLALSGNNYSIEFEIQTTATTTTPEKSGDPWAATNIENLRGKLFYSGTKLNQAYMIGYKPLNGLEENQLAAVWFGKTLHLPANYWALLPNGAPDATGRNGKKTSDKFSIDAADQEKIKKIIDETKSGNFGFVLVVVRSLPKSLTDTLEKVTIFKENKGDKKQVEYAIIRTNDPLLTIGN